MNKIVHKQHFSENVVQLVVEAPLIARSRRPEITLKTEDKLEKIQKNIYRNHKPV